LPESYLLSEGKEIFDILVIFHYLTVWLWEYSHAKIDKKPTSNHDCMKEFAFYRLRVKTLGGDNGGKT
jgi:hypothetical protein